MQFLIFLLSKLRNEGCSLQCAIGDDGDTSVCGNSDDDVYENYDCTVATKKCGLMSHLYITAGGGEVLIHILYWWCRSFSIRARQSRLMIFSC